MKAPGEKGYWMLRGQLREHVPLPAMTIAWVLLAPAALGDSVQNRSSDFAIEVDGRFSGGVSPGGALLDEWSDVEPLGFVSPLDADSPLLQIPAESEDANSLLYVTASPGPVPWESLYAIAALQPRTISSFGDGQTVAEIRFPVTVDGETTDFVLRVRSKLGGRGTSVMEYMLDVDGDGTDDFRPSALGIDVAASFGSSPLSTSPHLIVEARIPLSVPVGYGDLDGDGLFDPPDEVFLPDGHPGVIPAGPEGVGPFRVSFKRDPGDPEGVERDEGPEADIRILPGGSMVASNDSLPTSLVPTAFTRGNGNGDANVDLSDAIAVLGWLFSGGTQPSCLEAANSNGDSNLDIGDPIYLLGFLFQGGPAPPAPYPHCGTSPAKLGCIESTSDCAP